MTKSGWNMKKLGEIAETTSGGTPDRKTPAFFGGSIPWLKSGELEDAFIYDTEEKITPDALKRSAAKLFPSGTLLMAMYGATVGKTAVLKIEAATNQAVCAIFPRAEEARIDFLRFALVYQRPEILKLRYGGAQPNISQQVVRSLVVPLPPLAEQQKIAAALGLVQQATEQQERLMTLTEELKRALMHKLFTEGLRGEPQKQTEIGFVPQSWAVERLGGYLTEAQYGISARGSASGRYPMLRMTNQVRGRITSDDLRYVDITDEEFRRFRVDRRDILFNRTNSLDLVGRTAIFDLEGDFAFASYLIRLRTDADRLRPYFLNHYLNWQETQIRLKSIATRAVSQSNISATRLCGFPVPVPQPDEQDEVVERIDHVERKLSVHERKRAALSDLFRTLLHHLMTGQIRVRDIELPEWR